MITRYFGRLSCSYCKARIEMPLRATHVCAGCKKAQFLWREAETDDAGHPTKPAGMAWAERAEGDRFVGTYRPRMASRYRTLAFFVGVMVLLSVSVVGGVIERDVPVLWILGALLLGYGLAGAIWNRRSYVVTTDALRVIRRPFPAGWASWSLAKVERFVPDVKLDDQLEVRHFVRAERIDGATIALGGVLGAPLAMPDRQHAAFVADRLTERLTRLRMPQLGTGPYRVAEGWSSMREDSEGDEAAPRERAGRS